ncbi:MAG: 2-oxoacid:acceptor oxidoreductase family protein [Deltaproteobacteria bacterium]|nr:2-oxoacid:acceptor oxidoreductase family protein [Deltaproteobacteria bacterium]
MKPRKPKTTTALNSPDSPSSPKYPGLAAAIDGSSAVVAMETAAGEAAGAYPITPSTQMGEGWAAAVAAGQTNVHGRRLIFFEPEGEHAAAAVTAGMSMIGLRATNFSSGQGIAYMHESLYAAVGKRLTYVLNVAARAMTKHALNVHAGHDDYHAVDDTGFFQIFAKNVQEVADLNLIAHRIAELSLNPGICAQDGFLTSHVIESINLPERELVKEYLGAPWDLIETPTPAQRLVFGPQRRRIPEMFNLDYPAQLGVVQNQDSYQQGVAAQRPFYFDHIAALADRAFSEYATLTGRQYARVAGYRLDDADYVIVGQGSVVTNAEAVCDYLRATRKLKLGVLNLTMFRPFPADLVTHLLRGKRGVTVLERVDQPLAVDPPLLREIRAAMGQALENGRAQGVPPYAGVAACAGDQVPDFYSGCFGLGSRDLQPGDIVAAADNMLDSGSRRRQFYLGIDFVRSNVHSPQVEQWQQQLLAGYPHLPQLALRCAEEVKLDSEGSVSIRIHSVGGWGAITMGKNLALTAAELLGLHIQANPKYGSEKKGQPTTFYATLAREPIRLNCELRHVDVVLSPDANVFRHSNPLAGLAPGGVFVLQCDGTEVELWNLLPASARREIRQKQIRVFFLDAFKIAREEASDAELRYRMQGAAFMGAFFRVAPLSAEAGLDDVKLFDGIRKQLKKKFGHQGERVVEDNLRVIRRGFDQVRALDPAAMDESGAPAGGRPALPALGDPAAQQGIGNAQRFCEQVCALHQGGSDGLADPFAAISAMPAATSVIRDMTDVRFEVPEFIAARCTGCSRCWTQCPDTAIPGVVNTVEEVIEAAIATAANGDALDNLRGIVPQLARECRRVMKAVPFTTFADILSLAYGDLGPELHAEAPQRADLDSEFARVLGTLADFPLAKTNPFFEVPESKHAGNGGLLSITVNPNTCKGCMLCVEVCPDGALITSKQDEAAIAKLRRNWALWRHLPDTADRYVNIASLEEGIGVLPSLLLKKENYGAMAGGDGACMGCGEKTSIHLVLAAVTAMMQPRVARHIERLDDLIARLDGKARTILASGADLGAVLSAPGAEVAIPLDQSKRAALAQIAGMIAELKDLRWRYAAGPSGQGRAACGIANSTGCSSVWGSTYPYNPYPFPWVNHLFQDAPSIAIGLFEGHMRKMADGFIAVRRAEAVLAGEYREGVHEAEFTKFDWRQFSDEEFAMCPPIFAVGGDGAMMDIGFQNLSRLLASGKPARVIVLDTQVYSNTGGQACTSGYTGQVSDMAAFGSAQRGKEEVRKELSLLAIAHRDVFVLQSSQATPSHLIGGVLKGLQSRRPAIFVLHSPCPPEHGIADDAAFEASKLSLESRAFPALVYDPDGGPAMADRLSLDGNPALDDVWPSYDLAYVDDNGAEQTMTLPLTIADWAATEARFKRHFKPLPREAAPESLAAFHEYLQLAPPQRAHLTPFIYVLGEGRRLSRLAASAEIVRLAEERLHFWSQLRQMAGLELAPAVREALAGAIQTEFEEKEAALRRQFEDQLANLRAQYPREIARRLAQGLLKAGDGNQTIAALLAQAKALPDLTPAAASIAPTPALADTALVATAPVAPAGTNGAAKTGSEARGNGPYIDSERCTTCDECINVNSKLFAYNAQKQAYIKDPRAGTYKQLVTAAERCPVAIIHPAAPLNAKEKDVDKWVARAQPFNGGAA